MVVMFNCCDLEVFMEVMFGLVSFYFVVGGYVNVFMIVEFMVCGEFVDFLEVWFDVFLQVYIECVCLWLQGGVSVVGGCCEIMFSYIGDIVNVLGVDYQFIKFFEF